MDFFAHQDRARRRTAILLAYFVAAVLLTVVAVNVVLFLAVLSLGQPQLRPADWFTGAGALWATLGTLLVIGGGTLARYLDLRDGGAAVAQLVGARRIDTDTGDSRERVLLNVVQEMAIAAGTPAPSVWVMDNETGLNAFVAGFEPTEAVLVVTRGALDTFSRDALQGVVGHEFSHILNGDMRLNLRLYAVLAGIQGIARIGGWLMRSSRRSSGSARNNGNGIVVVGLALFLVGWIGLFFGRLIKAAVSRQREFLADAASVQFTRNPHGIAEALVDIRNAAHGSMLDNIAAEDMSHMCIATPLAGSFLQQWLATHPPLDERIRAIDPSWLARARVRRRQQEQAASPAAMAGPAAPGASAAAFAGGHSAVDAGRVVAAVGTLGDTQLSLAHALHAAIPAAAHELLRTPDGARVLMYALLVAGTDPAHEAAACALVARQDSADCARRLAENLALVRRLGTRLRLPLVDLALPALRPLPTLQRDAFLATCTALAALDRRHTIAEYVLLAVLRRHLAADAARPVRVLHRSYAGLGESLNTLLSALVHAGGGEPDARAGLHQRLLRGFGQPGTLRPAAAITAASLHAALVELATLAPLLKKPLLDACVEAVLHDGRLQVAELELVRAVGDALDCPVPPLPAVA